MKYPPIIALLLLTSSAFAAEYVLPAFALRVEGEDGSLWTSEVYVTNPGASSVLVYEGGLLPGSRSEGPPCLPIVQPFLQVPPYTTVLWPSSQLSVGIGCPAWALGALTFSADGEIEISSRIVNAKTQDTGGLLHGLGQEVRALPASELAEPGRRMLLPALGWQANACGPKAFETNLFIANPGEKTATVTLEPAPGAPPELFINGESVATPFLFSVPPQSMVRFDVSAPDTQLPVCLEPVVGSLFFTADQPVGVVGSVVDRRSQDARTVVPLTVH